MPSFVGLNAQVLGISVDSVPCLQAWAESLGGISYPLLSDFWPHGAVAERYGVLRPEGYSERAIFVIDKNGIIQYIDIHDIDDQPSNEVLLDEIRKLTPQQKGAMQDRFAGDEEDLPHGGVVMYCTRWCPDCRKARVWLEENNIPYQEVDITTNFTAARQVRSWGNGFQITPCFDIDGTILVDFDQEKLTSILLSK